MKSSRSSTRCIEASGGARNADDLPPMSTRAPLCSYCDENELVDYVPRETHLESRWLICAFPAIRLRLLAFSTPLAGMQHPFFFCSYSRRPFLPMPVALEHRRGNRAMLHASRVGDEFEDVNVHV